MTLTTAISLVFVVARATTLFGEAAQARGGRGPLTPEQREQQRAREAASGAKAPRPIEVGSVEKLVEDGKKLAEHRASITAEATRKAIAAAR